MSLSDGPSGRRAVRLDGYEPGEWRLVVIARNTKVRSGREREATMTSGKRMRKMTREARRPETAARGQEAGAGARAARLERPAPARHGRAGDRKPAYHHGDLRAALVDAAARLAAEVGPAAVTLREVARRAGVSQAAPYHHFADKGALIAAVAEEGFRLFDADQAAAIAEAEAAGATPSERMAALGASYVRFALAHPNYFRVMFRPYLFEGPRSEAFDQVALRSLERLIETTRAAREAAGLRDAQPIVPALAMWAMPHGLACLALDSPNASDLTPELTEQLARAATTALAAMPLDCVSAKSRSATRAARAAEIAQAKRELASEPQS